MVEYAGEVFATKRLWVRPFRVDDLDELIDLYGEPELMRFVDGVPRSAEETQKYLESYLSDYAEFGFGLYAILQRGDSRIVGRGGVIPVPQPNGALTGEVAFLLRRELWGRGLGTEFLLGLMNYVLLRCPLTHIFAHVNPANTASIRVLEKAGFHYSRSLPLEDEYVWAGGGKRSTSVAQEEEIL